MRASDQESKRGLNFTPEEIAQALLQQSRESFKLIQLDQEKPDFSLMTTFSTNLTTHIQRTILEEQNLERRANLLAYWMEILVKCYDHGDMHSTVAIAGALDSISIARLSMTHVIAKKKFNEQQIKTYEEIKRKTLPSNTYKINNEQHMTVPTSTIILNDTQKIQETIKFIKENIAQTEKQIELLKKFIQMKKEDKHESYILGRIQEEKDLLPEIKNSLLKTNQNLSQILSEQLQQAEASLSVLTTNLSTTQQRLPDYYQTLSARRTKLLLTDHDGPATLYIKSLTSSPSADNKTSSELQKTFFEKSEAMEKKIELKKEDTLKVIALKYIRAYAATGALGPLIDDILKNPSALDKVDPDVIFHPNFMKTLNDYLTHPLQNKEQLIGFLLGAGITLDSRFSNRNYDMVCKQADYRAQLSNELKEIIGNVYLKGSAKNFEQTKTMEKVIALNKFFHESYSVQWEKAQDEFKKLLSDLSVTMTNTIKEKLRQAHQQHMLDYNVLTHSKSESREKPKQPAQRKTL